jgi:hypothetical protein
MPGTPPASWPNNGSPSLRAIHVDVRKGTVSCLIGLSECEPKRASDRQHVQEGAL